MAKSIDPKIVDLLGRGKVHPALHVDAHGVVVGVVTGAGEYQLITSERKIYTPDDIKPALAFLPRPYPDLAGRWPEDDVDRFLSGEPGPTFSEVLALIVKALDNTMEFARPEHRALVAVWSILSYLFPLFLAFSRLYLLGERESGKSKLMMLLRAIAWNALLMLNPTPAVLFRLVHEFKPTLLLDESEGLSKDDARDVRSIVNSGYKHGGTVPRCEGEKVRRVELFSVYAPLALAAIKHVNAVTEDRCIPLTLQRGTDRRRINADVDLAAPEFARIRSGCYRLLLTRWREVHEVYRTVTLPDWLNGRARELWRPLLAVASLADGENGLILTPDLLELARAHMEDRADISAEGEALLAILADRLGESPAIILHPGELTEDLRKRLGWRDAPSPELASAWLRRFGFSKARPPRDRVGTRYEVTAERLRDVQVRYLLSETYTPTPTSPNSAL